MLPWPSRPRRALSRQRDAPEVAAVDVRDPVVAGQPLVDERVVRGQQLHDAAVLADDAVHEQLGLPPEALAQLVVEVGEVARRRDVAAQVAQHQPLAGEVVHERPRPRVVQHAPDLALEHHAAGAAGRARPRSAAVVRHRAPEEERQPRRQLEVRHRRRGLGGGQRRLGPEEELRVGQDQPQAVLDARSKPTPCPARGVLLENRREVVVGDRPAIGAPGQRRRGWCARTRPSSAARLAGRAREDALAAGRGARARSTSKGPVRLTQSMSGRPFMSCRSWWRSCSCSGSSDSAWLRSRNVTPTSCGPALTAHARLEALVDRVGRFGHVHVGGQVVLRAADLGREHALAVEADLQRVRELEPGHVADDVAGQEDAEVVLAVLRERVA